ncbi:DUF7547 family protein [Haloplanus halobius]|uniref:DUF7547 family protein n=1 Tax=Haloplanus halobius TaxID=2934938 RepID=UPI00200EC14F|nr:hypothetical protein [Haloplanus sp. XH21]
MSNRDDEELAVLLADLERTLTDLRAAIDEDVRQRRARPPTPGELLRFTESHTIPTLIALLEATVRSLELLRALLRLAGPGSQRSSPETRPHLRDRLADADAPDTETLRDALADLRTALTGADLPEDSAAGSVLADAQDLTAEIDDRLAEARSDRAESPADEQRDRRRRRSAGVAIDVREEGAAAEPDETDDEAAVNVDAELESIRESIESEEDEGADENGDEAGAAPE